MTAAIQAIQASVSGISQLPDLSPTYANGMLPAMQAPATGFSQLLVDGIGKVDTKLAEADSMMRAFALDDGAMPVHQVTIALEQARLSFELMIQVRNRLLESYQHLMNMQI